jgi:hypothetical protein
VSERNRTFDTEILPGLRLPASFNTLKIFLLFFITKKNWRMPQRCAAKPRK